MESSFQATKNRHTPPRRAHIRSGKAQWIPAQRYVATKPLAQSASHLPFLNKNGCLPLTVLKQPLSSRPKVKTSSSGAIRVWLRISSFDHQGYPWSRHGRSGRTYDPIAPVLILGACSTFSVAHASNRLAACESLNSPFNPLAELVWDSAVGNPPQTQLCHRAANAAKHYAKGHMNHTGFVEASTLERMRHD